MKAFFLNVHVSVQLTEEQLWPDGDGPENPTVEDVKELIRDEGGITQVLDEWNLMSDYDFTVTEYKPKTRP